MKKQKKTKWSTCLCSYRPNKKTKEINHTDWGLEGCPLHTRAGARLWARLAVTFFYRWQFLTGCIFGRFFWRLHSDIWGTLWIFREVSVGSGESSKDAKPEIKMLVDLSMFEVNWNIFLRSVKGLFPYDWSLKIKNLFFFCDKVSFWQI